MPVPKPMASLVLEPKNMKAISLPHVVMSYHVNQPTHSRIIDPEAISDRLARFGRSRRMRVCDSTDSVEGSALRFFEKASFLVARYSIM